MTAPSICFARYDYTEHGKYQNCVIYKKDWLSAIKVRGVPEGKIKVRRGWVWEGVSPSHTLGKKSKYELNGGFSCIF